MAAKIQLIRAASRTRSVHDVGVAAVFLDRDGTINVKAPDGGYLQSAADFRWLPGAAQGAAALAHAGFALFVVSNQRGVARGLVSDATLAATELLIERALKPLGARIEEFRYCPHDLNTGCECRKPAPGLILSLARERGLDLQRSWMIGDAPSDVAAGKAAGCRTVRIGEPQNSLGEGPAPDLVASSLLVASERIISGSSVAAAAGAESRTPPRAIDTAPTERPRPTLPRSGRAPTAEIEERNAGSRTLLTGESTMVYRSKAPLRVSFAGGGTDVPPFPSREGGLVLNAAINRYAYGALSPRTDHTIHIESVDFGLEVSYRADHELSFDGKLDLVKAAIQKVGRGRDAGLDLFLHSSAPPGSGLGSSSAMIVTLIGLLKDFYGLALTDYQIAQLACSVEREDLQIRGGLQDQYAATFGGFNYIEFEGDHVIVNPLRIPPDVIHELEHNMLLCYTGRTRASDHIIDDQTKGFIEGDPRVVEGLRLQKELAKAMKDALLRRQLEEFGDLLGTAWRYKKQLSPRITTSFIDEAYEHAINAGALGGKVTGAGGGGYMLFFCPFQRKHKVAEVLTAMGAVVTEFEFAQNGLTTWCRDV